MSPLVKFLRLPNRSKQLFFEVFSWMIFIQVGLIFCNYYRMKKLLKRVSRPFPEIVNDDDSRIRAVIYAINAIGCRLPGQPCLRNALTAELMLTNRGYPVKIRIGTPLKKGNGLKSQAWVEKSSDFKSKPAKQAACHNAISEQDALFRRLSWQLS